MDQPQLSCWCEAERSRISLKCCRWAQNPTAQLPAQRRVPVSWVFFHPLPRSELTSLETHTREISCSLAKQHLSFTCPDFSGSQFLLLLLFRHFFLTIRAGIIPMRRSPGNNLTPGAQALGSSRSAGLGLALFSCLCSSSLPSPL